MGSRLGKGCQAKRRFDNKDAARVRARQLFYRSSLAFKAYRCPFCSGWHLTTGRT